MFQLTNLVSGSSWTTIMLILAMLGMASSYGTGGGGGVFNNLPITYIDDESDTGGLFLGTGDFSYNYAFQSAQLYQFNWAGVSVNGNQVYITLLNNLTLTTTLTSLNSTVVDTIISIKSQFIQNLAGLSLSYGSITKYITGKGITSYGYNKGYTPSYGTNERFNGNPIFNYYNLNNSPLQNTLAGDVVVFDLNGNNLDIFTADDSLLDSSTETILYYDQDFFSYSAPNLPLNINRIFVDSYFVFFIYNDGSILLKTSTVLNPIELNLVVAKRAQVQALVQYQIDAAAVQQVYSGSQTGSPTLPGPGMTVGNGGSTVGALDPTGTLGNVGSTVSALDPTGLLGNGGSTAGSLDPTGTLGNVGSTVGALDPTGLLGNGGSTAGSLDPTGTLGNVGSTVGALDPTGLLGNGGSTGGQGPSPGAGPPGGPSSGGGSVDLGSVVDNIIGMRSGKEGETSFRSGTGAGGALDGSSASISVGSPGSAISVGAGSGTSSRSGSDSIDSPKAAVGLGLELGVGSRSGEGSQSSDIDESTVDSALDGTLSGSGSSASVGSAMPSVSVGAGIGARSGSGTGPSGALGGSSASISVGSPGSAISVRAGSGTSSRSGSDKGSALGSTGDGSTGFTISLGSGSGARSGKGSARSSSTGRKRQFGHKLD